LVTIYATVLRFREATNLTWADVDFQGAQIHMCRKERGQLVQAWQPKDHEMRSIPLPPLAIVLLRRWRSEAPKRCPYVFMDHGRWDYYRQQVSRGLWRPGQDLINNLLRRFKTLCRKAGVGSFTIHDLRRSCLTNWARHLPVHVVQQLAGHSDIKTTQTYYLSVGTEDIRKAQETQRQLLGKIPDSDRTDPRLTHFRKKTRFPG
jgi:integrase